MSCEHLSYYLDDDECHIICKECGQHLKKISSDTNEIEFEKGGKSRFGIISNNSTSDLTSNSNKKGEVILDVSLPYEPRTKTSLGSGEMDEISKEKQRNIRTEKRIEEEVLQKLIDPLRFLHPPNAILQLRNAASSMLYILMKDSPEEEEEEDSDESQSESEESTTNKKRKRSNPKMKNRGCRKKAVYAHLIKRVILCFLPEYNECDFNKRILLPYFGNNMTLKDIAMKIKKYGIPLFRETFPDFDRHYEKDLERHLKCKIRNILNDLIENGIYRHVYTLNEDYYRIIDFVGNFIFNDSVKCKLQKWDFSTQVGVIISYLGISTPEEIIDIMKKYDDRCVLSTTIHTRLRSNEIKEIIDNAFVNSPKYWSNLFQNFTTDRLNLPLQESH